jgi:hypothetical protein
MKFLSWLRNRLVSPNRSPRGRAHRLRRLRLYLEQLEERLTPANLFTPNELYVNYLENKLLGRAADPNSLKVFVPPLDAVPPGADPTQARISVINQITSSQEYKQDTVDHIFRHYLHRSAFNDPNTLNAFVQLLNNGATQEQAAAFVVSSPEYFNNEGGTQLGFLNGLFQDALQRPADGDAIAALGANPDRFAVAVAVLNSVEYHTKLVNFPGSLSTGGIVNFLPYGYYQLFLGRTAGINGGVDESSGFVAELSAGLPDELVIAQIASSGEAYNKSQAPPAVSAPVLAASSDTGISNHDDITNATTLVFTGTADPGSTVKLWDSASLLDTTTAKADGTWTFSIAGLGEGVHTISATATNAAGVTSDHKNLTVTIDRTPPSLSASLDKAAAATGWYNSATGAPTYSYMAIDSLSGLDSNSPAKGSYLFGEGANQTYKFIVTDVAGNTASVTSPPVSVDRTPPQVSIAGPTVAVPGMTVTLTDNGSSDALSGLDTRTWRLGLTTGSASTFSFTPTSPGTYPVTLTWTDKAGNTGSATQTVQVIGVVMQGGNLYIAGTNGSDIINVNGANPANVIVSVNGKTTSGYNVSKGRVVIYTLDGNDFVNLSGRVDAEVHLGSGKDTVLGSLGKNIIFGGSGNDFLIALGRADVLVGGGGQDVLIGLGGQDILIAGSLNTGYNTYAYLDGLRTALLTANPNFQAMLNDLVVNGVNHPELPSQKCLLLHYGGNPSAFIYRKNGGNRDNVYGLQGNDFNRGY